MADKFRSSFDVLICVYFKDNATKFKAALHSIFTNSLLPGRVILVCDGPITKEIADIIQTFALRHPKLLKVVRLDENVGLAHALNVGLSYSNAAWIARADADDINHPSRFEVTAEYLAQNPDVDVVGTSILEFDENHEARTIRRVPLSDPDIKAFMKRRSPFNHMTVAYRRQLVIDCGGYPNLYCREDYGLWAKLAGAGVKMANMDEVLVHVSAGSAQIQRRGGLKYAKVEYQLQLALIYNGIKGPIAAVLDGLTRGLVFLMPQKLRHVVYAFFLRDRHNSSERIDFLYHFSR